MGSVIDTPDGSVTITNRYDVVDIVRHHIGDEVATYIEQNMVAYDKEKERTEMEFNSDYLSIQGTNEEYHDCIVEAESALGEIINELSEGGRMNKVKLLQKLKDIQWNLNECI